ncbi:MAG: DNA alkylation repair protein [Bacteroidota bacterium]
MQKEVKEIVAQLLAAFNKSANKAQAIKMEAYMRNQFEFFGLQKEVRAELSKPFIQQLANSSEKNMEDIVKFLWSQPQRECHYVAMEYLMKVHRKWNRETLTLFEWMIDNKSWWDTVDAIASNMVGKLLQRYPDLIWPSIERWDAHPSFWFHRTTLIFQLKYAANTDKFLLFAQCEKYISSKEFFIQKAVGWSLRQYSKFNPTDVQKFVDQHTLSTVSLREAKKYL